MKISLCTKTAVAVGTGALLFGATAIFDQPSVEPARVSIDPAALVQDNSRVGFGRWKVIVEMAEELRKKGNTKAEITVPSFDGTGVEVIETDL